MKIIDFFKWRRLGIIADFLLIFVTFLSYSLLLLGSDMLINHFPSTNQVIVVGVVGYVLAVLALFIVVLLLVFWLLIQLTQDVLMLCIFPGKSYMEDIEKKTRRKLSD